ncbi:MAG: hypothetical protein ABIJ16_10040 [Bacteroidota bacterium]
MDNNRTLSFVIIALLFVLFGAISLLLVFRSESRWLTAKKFRIGALILSFTAIISTQSAAQRCYVPVKNPGNNFSFEKKFEKTTGQLVIDMKYDTHLKGKITERTDTSYSFTIRDMSDSLIMEGTVLPDDGEFNSSEEEFYINVFNVFQGKYRLQLYSGSVNKKEENIFLLEVKNEPIILCYW